MVTVGSIAWGVFEKKKENQYIYSSLLRAVQMPGTHGRAS
jgi:hypothetical protein